MMNANHRRSLAAPVLRCRCPQGQPADRGRGQPESHAARVRAGRRLLGLQYGFEFDEQLQDGDTCVENQGVKLLIDPMSFQYLGGAEIDYREGLDGAQFVIRNPNAQTTCGCGSSFTA